MSERKKAIAQIIKEAELSKFADEIMQETQEGNPQEGQVVADQIFDKLLSELDIDSLN